MSESRSGGWEARPLTAGQFAKISIANFGASMGFVVPLSFTLAIKVDEISPRDHGVLGAIIGLAQLLYLVLAPFVGMWSDRTRSRWGRRRPFIAGGLVLGGAGLAVVAVASAIPTLAIGWILTLLGWVTTQASIYNLAADVAPETQRGRLFGLLGFSTQAAPIVGIALASLAVGRSDLAVLLPGVVGAACVIFLLFLGRGMDTRHELARPAPQRRLISAFGFNPRRHPDFAWNWAGRFLFFIGLYLTSSYVTFFYAQRLGVPVAEVGGAVALIGVSSVAAAALGALVGGYLSDAMGRRKFFVLAGSVLFGIGAVVEAFAHSFAALAVGALLTGLAIAVFNAVDSAMAVALVPDQLGIGRYLAVVSYSQKIPAGVAPLVVPFILGSGRGLETSNYTAVYLLGAVVAVSGGLLIAGKVRGIR